MTRTPEQLEPAAAEAEVWLESLDPTTTPAENISDLRAIADAVGDVPDAERRLRRSVLTAHSQGRSWGRISMALGVSRQAARERYGEAPQINGRLAAFSAPSCRKSVC